MQKLDLKNDSDLRKHLKLYNRLTQGSHKDDTGCQWEFQALSAYTANSSNCGQFVASLHEKGIYNEYDNKNDDDGNGGGGYSAAAAAAAADDDDDDGNDDDDDDDDDDGNDDDDDDDEDDDDDDDDDDCANCCCCCCY
ncbi:hypothetical protein PoB_001223800 [Plakobranchus ocellatus]|uniref:Uncharacterized protein n=1 Tax=Plakobranchus ocellatus TaxID=259542 RepID=A0AAV3YU17_9GAST|nr:hypothetical protein PoB_001223800 [Plakobranchus ocellatus]